MTTGSDDDDDEQKEQLENILRMLESTSKQPLLKASVPSLDVSASGMKPNGRETSPPDTLDRCIQQVRQIGGVIFAAALSLYQAEL
jgi:arginine/lysine/ornithine decarboxylase